MSSLRISTMKLAKNLIPVLLFATVASAYTACKPDEPASVGKCKLAPADVLDCSVTRTTDKAVVTAADAGLEGYFCTGTARPDANPRYYDGMPMGTVCDDMGYVEGQGQGYCCTTVEDRCAYNPVAECDDETYSGYECRGNRPDFMNALVYCREGIHDGDYISYCCRDYDLPKPQQGTAAGFCDKDVGKIVNPDPTKTGYVQANCAVGLDNWGCVEGQLPTSESLAKNGSRSDYYAPICTIAGPVLNTIQPYCCFTPKLTPVGASCEGMFGVPGCGDGRFGFACYGTDKPSDYHTPMICNDPGVPGTSAAGYPATLYCCDYDMTLAAAAVTATP